MTEESATPAAQYVTKVAVKLPYFWSDDPDLWFIYAKSSFRNAQITQSRTKFDHVVQKLLQSIMVSVRGLILSSSSTSSMTYEDLKAKLVASYTLSRWQRVLKVIHKPRLATAAPQPRWTSCWPYSLKIKYLEACSLRGYL